MMTIIVTEPSQREHTAPDRSSAWRRVRPALAAIAALMVLGAITLSRPRVPRPTEHPSLAIPASVPITPSDSSLMGHWVETGRATGKLSWVARSPVGYVLPTDDGVVTITDDDDVVPIGLPDLETMRGITADESRVVVYGQSPTGPSLWESPDGLTWTSNRLPWQGTAQMITFEEGRIVVFGITPDADGLTGIIATEGPTGGWELASAPTPAARVFGIPGGFVIRDRDPKHDVYRYAVTRDMVIREPFADRLLISSVGLVAGVIETAAGPRLISPPLDVVIDPPDWPVVGLWREGTRFWLQTAESLWTSLDGQRWDDIPLDRTVWSGVAIALPVGDHARVVVSDGTGVLRIFRWTTEDI